MSWQPSATLDVLRARAAMNTAIRNFFALRTVLEVETPVLSRYATVDRHIDSFRTHTGAWLQTSPEFAMKRLLAAGSGPIYQIARVFRRDEQGRHHNPEFTLLEWYRPGFDHHALMDEVEALLQQCVSTALHCERLSYQDAFQRHAGFDPLALDAKALEARARDTGMGIPESLTAAERGDVDLWLDLWMSAVVGPQLGQQTPTFIYDFPASQAALSRVRPGTPPLAERFELFWRGVELANGFHELTDAAEQQRRFEADQAWRRDNGREVPPFDQALIGALSQGLPPCAGVALGLDRVLALHLGLPTVAAAIAFSSDRA
ncbi:EF-P lysine aminoacylase GenX [Sinimarinibacterium sp. CAU 1509]|nr:EF-P lysine aminoacylase GenX [Sinimarinibacterium sp. CAU 1509]